MQYRGGEGVHFQRAEPSACRLVNTTRLGVRLKENSWRSDRIKYSCSFRNGRMQTIQSVMCQSWRSMQQKVSLTSTCSFTESYELSCLVSGPTCFRKSVQRHRQAGRCRDAGVELAASSSRGRLKHLINVTKGMLFSGRLVKKTLKLTTRTRMFVGQFSPIRNPARLLLMSFLTVFLAIRILFFEVLLG